MAMIALLSRAAGGSLRSSRTIRLPSSTISDDSLHPMAEELWDEGSHGGCSLSIFVANLVASSVDVIAFPNISVHLVIKVRSDLSHSGVEARPDVGHLDQFHFRNPAVTPKLFCP
jgi:hypothetical protein